MTLALYRRRAFRKKPGTSTVLRRAFDKAVRRKPPVVAADAGPMQIQMREGVVWRCAGAERKSTAVGAEREKSDVGVKLEHSRRRDDAVCRSKRHRDTERADARKGFVL